VYLFKITVLFQPNKSRILILPDSRQLNRSALELRACITDCLSATKEKFLNGRLCIDVRKAILNNNRSDTRVANVSKLQNRSTSDTIG